MKIFVYEKRQRRSPKQNDSFLTTKSTLLKGFLQYLIKFVRFFTYI